MMAYLPILLMIILLVLHASMGWSPPSPPSQLSRRLLHSRVAHTVGGVLMAATLLTTPLSAEATLTNQDFTEIVKIINDSEDRMTLRLKESEARTEERMILNMEKLSNKIDRQANVYFWVPIVSTGIVALSNVYVSKRFDNAIARFVSEKDTIKKELEENTQAKATQGTIAGVILVLVLMASGATIAYAVIHPQ